MVDRNAGAAAAWRAWRRRIAVGAIFIALSATSAAAAGTRADAVITALALEQGRHCVVTRAPDAHVTVRGGACDGRRFIRAILTLLTSADAKAAPLDLDLDIAVNSLDGFNDETLHDVTLRLSVQRGVIAAFAFAAKGAGDVSGGLRAIPNHPTAIVFEAGDAGAFLRWSGLYRHVGGGALMVAMDVPAADGSVDDGLASLRTFAVTDDPALRPLTPLLFDHRRARHPRYAFVRLRVRFRSQAGRVTFSDGILTGEPLGASLAGSLDLAQSRLDLRGVMVPAIQFSPILPIFLPGAFGLIGSDYAISGPASAPVLRIDPLRTLDPGFMRKLFRFEPREHALEPNLEP